MDRKLCLTLASLALLASCTDDTSCFTGTCQTAGGGSGGGGTSGGTIILTEDNFEIAVREAWYAMEASAAVPAFVVATGVGDTSGGIVSLGGPASKAIRSNVVLDPFGPTVYNCPVSGTFTISGDVADPNTVTPGDFFTFDSSACDSGTGFTVDGTHQIDIDSIDGDVNSGLYAQGQTITLDNFRAQASTYTVELNGDHSSVIDAQDPAFVEATYSGGALYVEEGSVSVGITNFDGVDYVETNSPYYHTIDVDGTANSSRVPGSFRFFTLEQIRRYEGENPHDGILTIQGANGGSARVVASDATGCNVQLDANGNTNHELTIHYTWEEFFAL